MEEHQFNEKLNIKSEELLVSIADKKSNKTLKFVIANKKTLWRAKTLYKKEPVTIDWIRKFKKGDILFDVGANVGMYTIFAAVVSEAKVFCFEPESSNFFILNKNIQSNNLNKQVKAYLVGISNKSCFTKLHLGENKTGGSHHNVGENALDHNLEQRDSYFEQGIFTISLNELCDKWNFQIPNHLKIDVDGIESKIIEESDILLSSKKLQTILIEINPNRDEDKLIIEKLKKYNFKFDDSQVQQATRKDGLHKGYAEFVFYR